MEVVVCRQRIAMYLGQHTHDALDFRPPARSSLKARRPTPLLERNLYPSFYHFVVRAIISVVHLVATCIQQGSRMEEDGQEKIIHPLVQWRNAMELSVRDGDVEKLRELLQGETGGIAATLETLLVELDPVHIACAAGHREMVRFLLTEVAPWSVMVHDKECGATALHTCARFGRVGIARDLLGYGALVGSHDRGECTPRK